MKPNVLLTSIFRKPFRSLVLLCLILLVTFFFGESMAEYYLVYRETERLGESYRAVGILMPVDEEREDITEEAEWIIKDPLVSDYHINQYGSVYIPAYLNVDLNGFSIKNLLPEHRCNNTDIFFYGTLKSLRFGKNKLTGRGGYHLRFDVDQLIEGYPEYGQKESAIQIFAFSEKPFDELPQEPYLTAQDMEGVTHFQKGQRYFIRACWDRDFMSANWQMADQHLQLKPLYEGGPVYYPLASGASIDFSLPEWAKLKEDMDLVHRNIHSFEIKATQDMSALPESQEASRFLYLTEGRLLNGEDHKEKRNVCVIHHDFAQMRGISLGDEIDFQFYNKKIPGRYIIGPEDRAQWPTYPMGEQTFQVVGLYKEKDIHYTSATLKIYIPQSTLPLKYRIPLNDFISAYNFSFVLGSSKHQQQFEDTYGPKLKERGTQLKFVENRAASFWEAVSPMQQGGRLRVLIFSGVYILSLLLSLFLYVSWQKQNLAIERALGLSEKRVLSHFVGPLGGMSCLAIGLGGGFGIYYAQRKAEETLSTIVNLAGGWANTQISLGYILLFLFLLWGLFLLLIYARGRRLSKTPVLRLLSESEQKQKKKKSGIQGEKEAQLAAVNLLSHQMDALMKGEIQDKHFSKKAVGLFGRRMLVRRRVKSGIFILVAGLFVLSLLWMQQRIKDNHILLDQMYENIQIEGEVLKKNDSTWTGTDGIIPLALLEQMEQEGLLQTHVAVLKISYSQIQKGEEEPFKVGFSAQGINRSLNGTEGFSLRGLRLLPGRKLTEMEQVWMPEMLAKQKVPIVLSGKMAQELGLALGDVVQMKPKRKGYRRAVYEVIGVYDELIDKMSPMAKLSLVEIAYSGGGPLFLPFSAAETITGGKMGYDELNLYFNPKKNKELFMKREAFQDMVAQANSPVPLRLQLWDWPLRQVVNPLEKNLSLLELLYPITLGVSMVVAFLTALLFTLQRAKDAAVLRVLGVPKRRVKKSLIREILFQSLMGFGLSLIAMLWFQGNGDFLKEIQSGLILLLYFISVFAGVYTGASMVTEKKPLAMLQVKE